MNYIWLDVLLLVAVLLFPLAVMVLLRHAPKGWDVIGQSMAHHCLRCGMKMVTPPNLARWTLCSQCWLDDMEQARFLQAKEERDGAS